MAEDMVEGLADFTQKTTPSSIKTVKFSIFQADMLGKFITATNKVAQKEQAHTTGTIIQVMLAKEAEYRPTLRSNTVAGILT